MKRMLQREVTGLQVPQASIDAILTDKRLPKPSTTRTYEDLREVRRDATVSLVREVAPGPILAANWSYEKVDDSVPDEWLELIKEDVENIRGEYLLQAVRGLNDYGWVGFEKVWKKEDGYARIDFLKNLLPEYTDICTTDQGRFVGFWQNDIEQTFLPAEKALLLSQDVEGTNWYGQGKLEIVAKIQDKWDDSDDGANRYDKKIAGSHWVVYYPLGTTIVDGVETDNFELAGNLLRSLESSGMIRLPAAVQSHVADLNAAGGKSEWKIEPISDTQARQHSFVARLEYLDRLKVRGYGFPEDVILKSRYAPKTEQGVHANIIATAQDVQHQYIVRQLNKGIVNQTLRYNWGKKAEGKVYIVPAPITNMSLTFLQDVYKMMLNNQTVVGEEYKSIDVPELRTKVAVPHNGKEPELIGQTAFQTPKNVENPTEQGSFKSEGVQN